jgi:hypothetical protein
MNAMVKDSLVPQQQYDEVFAKYQGAKSQMIAVDAEIADVKNGVRIEQQTMALGQKDRAQGALEEVQVAEKERYIIAPQDMKIESITLKLGNWHYQDIRFSKVLLIIPYISALLFLKANWQIMHKEKKSMCIYLTKIGISKGKSEI